MRAYVINLPASTRRRQQIEDQLTRAGLSYEFVEAVDGMRLTASERAGLVDEQRVAASPRWLTQQAIGCALSHRRVYQRIVEEEEAAALVLEDDAVLLGGMAELAHDISQHMHPCEVVLLYFQSFKPCRLSEQDAVSVGRYRLLYPMDVRQLIGAVAYVVSHGAARSLADAIVPVRAAADSWGHYHELGMLDSLRCVFPRPVAHTSIESTLGYGSHSSVRRRLKQLTGWPIPQLRALNRRRIGRNMTRVRLVREAAPLALNLSREQRLERSRNADDRG